MLDKYERGARVLARIRIEMEAHTTGEQWHKWYRALEVALIELMRHDISFNKREFLNEVGAYYSRMKDAKYE